MKRRDVKDVDDCIAYFGECSVTEEEILDELVQDVKVKEASAINNGGCEAQLRYLYKTIGFDSMVKLFDPIA